MGKAILITTKNEIKEVEIDYSLDDMEVNNKLRKFIDEDCEFYQTLPPNVISEMFRFPTYPANKSAIGVIMLIDEEGKLNDLPINPIATYIYGYDIIVGNALLISTKANEYGEIIFCGIPDDYIKKIQRCLNSFVNAVNKYSGS